MVTNGGYGGVQIALSYGVPLVVAGTTEDKPEVAARVAWSGAGINLKTATPAPQRCAMRYARCSTTHGIARAPGAASRVRALRRRRPGVELLEQLAATGTPVLRAEPAPRRELTLFPGVR